MTLQSQASSSDLGSVLLSSAPGRPSDGEMQFGRFVGHWSFEGREFADDGSEPTDKGTITIGWILQGHALQDVWAESYRSDGGPLLLGTTVRFYDAGSKTWRSVWHNPISGVIRVFVGRATSDGIAFEGADGKGTPIRWVFSDARANSFTWRGESKVNGVWRTTEELHAVRAAMP
jgi:hypothetical protein